MKILINCSNLKIGGGLQVANSFLTEISKRTDHDYVIVISSPLQELISDITFTNNHQLILYDTTPSPFGFIWGNVKFLDQLVEKYHIDRVFTIFGPSYWRPKTTQICGFAKAQYIYKNSPFFEELSFKDLLKLKVKEFIQIQDFKRNTDILITENKDVSEKIGKRLNKPTFTVTNYYNQVFEDRSKWGPKPLPEFEGRYLLTISANYSHKNLKIIPQVIVELLDGGVTKYKFAITINKGDIPSTPQADQYIEYLGRVHITECPSLYEQATFMFLPTLLETFSASYTEAMFMKRNILTSDLGFARGICGDAAEYFDPLDPADIAEKIIALGEDTERQERLKHLGTRQLEKFDNFEERARKYVEIVEQGNIN